MILFELNENAKILKETDKDYVIQFKNKDGKSVNQRISKKIIHDIGEKEPGYCCSKCQRNKEGKPVGWEVNFLCENCTPKVLKEKV